MCAPGAVLTDQTVLIEGSRIAAAGEATHYRGSIEGGKLADMVLLDANPLDDIRNTQRITGVVLNGRYLDRSALDALGLRRAP
jgi:predicted amidohydrolase YtcJ